MAQAVIDDIDKFHAFLAAQPLCQWAAQKQRDLDQGITQKPSSKKQKDDNAELAAALSSMA